MADRSIKAANAVRCERFATLEWPRDDHGISDYAHPKVIPLPKPRLEEVFPPIDKRTHRMPGAVAKAD